MSQSGRRVIEDESGWLQYHSVGRFPGQREAIGAAMSEFADMWLSLDDRRWMLAGERRRHAIELWSELVGGVPGSVFTVENVTLAFSAFVESLPRASLVGRKVLIAADCFPSLHFLMVELAARIGFKLVTVPIAPGDFYVTDDQFIAAWDEDVALAMVNWITSVSSKRADLERLIAHGKKTDSLVALDITQGVGIVPIDLSALKVDFAAATSLKWLCGVPGTGFAYVDPDLLSSLNPRTHGWQSQPDPTKWDLDRFTLAPDARRFNNGTASTLPYFASLPGLEWVTAQGIDALAAHNRHLCHRLIEIVDRHGLTLASPREDSQRGGSVMIAMPSADAADTLRRKMLAIGFTCDARSERLRWSPGAVTTLEAVNALDRALETIGVESLARSA